MAERQNPGVVLAATAGFSALAAAAMTAAWFRHRAANVDSTSSPPPSCSCRIAVPQRRRHQADPYDPLPRTECVQCSAAEHPCRMEHATQPLLIINSGPLFPCSYLSWDDYFIALAFLSAQRSKDPNKQVSDMQSIRRQQCNNG
jgi:hypothetical protein